MKNTKLKLISGLTLTLALSFAFLPFSAGATSTTTAPTLRSKIQARPTLMAQNKEKGTSTLREAREKTRVNSTSTKGIKEVKLPKTVTEGIAKADTEIAKRIDSLNQTLEKISSMKNVSDSEKASIKSDVQSEITKLEALKSKIDSDTDLATIKKDLASISTGSRIYMLVIPRMNILASVDKVNTISTMMETVVAKLTVRVSELKATGADVAAVETALANVIKKITDARSEALTAQTSVSDLVPDNGDKAKIESNNVSLKAAKANIKTANQNLNDARKAISNVTTFLKAPEEDFGKIEKIDKNEAKAAKGKAVKETSTKKKSGQN
jgi:hypothetical protein